MKESIIVPIHEKSDKTDCNNYRGISLLSTSLKILSNILLSTEGQNWDIKIVNRLFENVSQFKYLCTTVKHQNLIKEEIKRRLSCVPISPEPSVFPSVVKNLKIGIHKTIILSVILYGCETWSLTQREKHRLRVLENKVLKRIFGQKRDDVTGGWRKLHNEELRDLYSSPCIIRIIKARRMRWKWHVARMGEKINAYRLFVGKPGGKRPLGRPRRGWVDNIKMDLLEIGWGGVDWIALAQDRDKWRALVNAVLNLRVP
jgi:hypothetical protein